MYPRAECCVVMVSQNSFSTGKCGKWFHWISPSYNELIERFDYMLQLVVDNTKDLLSSAT